MRRVEWVFAGGADSETAKGEVFADVLTGRRDCTFFKSLLDALEGSCADQTLMLSLAQRDVPFLEAHHTTIERIGEQVSDTLFV